MTDFMIYLVFAPLTVIACMLLMYPIVLRHKRRKIEENSRIVQEILDEYTREVELRAKFDMAYNNRASSRKVNNVDFVEHGPQQDDARGWKLIYNKELGIYQKVRR